MKTNDHEGVTNFRIRIELYIHIRVQLEGVAYFELPDTNHFLSRDSTKR